MDPADPQREPSVWGVLTLVEDVKNNSSKGGKNHAPKQILLSWNPYLIGRNETTAVIIPNPCISGVHCILSCIRQSSQPHHHAVGAVGVPTLIPESSTSPTTALPASHLPAGLPPTVEEDSQGRALQYRPAADAVLDASIADMSTNGCYVNGTRLGKGSSRRLSEGDVLDLVISKKVEHSCYDIKYQFSYLVPTLTERSKVGDDVSMASHQTGAPSPPPSPRLGGAGTPPPPLSPALHHIPSSNATVAPPTAVQPLSKHVSSASKAGVKLVGTPSTTATPGVLVPTTVPPKVGAVPSPKPAAAKEADGNVLVKMGSSMVSGVRGLFSRMIGSGASHAPATGENVNLDAATEQADLPPQQKAAGADAEDSSVKQGLSKKVRSHIPFDERYEMSEDSVLGQGSFATVYKAICKETGKVVAIKEVNMARTMAHMQNRADGQGEGESPQGATKNEEEQRRRRDELRQKREIEILQAVNHAHVVQLLDFEHEAAKRLSFVLEFAHGGELFGLIRKLGHLEEADVAVIIKQLLHGVSYLHGIGVVHRDLKLENILLLHDVTKPAAAAEEKNSGFRHAVGRTPPAQGVGQQPQQTGMTPRLGSNILPSPRKGVVTQGNNVLARMASGTNTPRSPQMDPVLMQAAPPESPIDRSKLHIKIADFGLSRILSSEAGLMSTMCGTPIYVAPEVTMFSLRPNRSGYTSAADMWSVGVICYALLCGRPPFPHAKDEMGRKHKTKINYNTPIEWSIAAPQHGQAGASSSTPGSIHPQERRFVSMQVRSFLSQLLVMKPEDRTTANEALDHPWLKDVVLPAGTGDPLPSAEDEDAETAATGTNAAKQGLMFPAAPTAGGGGRSSYGRQKRLRDTEQGIKNSSSLDSSDLSREM